VSVHEQRFTQERKHQVVGVVKVDMFYKAGAWVEGRADCYKLCGLGLIREVTHKEFRESEERKENFCIICE
jgi:hypothetical protein